jgi:hypothetical protein
LGVIAVLGIQYFRRKTPHARWLTAGVALVSLSAVFLQWPTAFAIQQRLSPIPGASASVNFTFDPSIGKSQSPSGIGFDMANIRHRGSEDDVLVYLPLRVAGLPADTMLKADRSEVRLTRPDGKTENLELGNDLEIRNEGPGDSEKRIHHGIHIQGDLYRRVIDRPVRLEIDYSLTLFRLTSSHALPALGGDQRIPDLGWCATKVNEGGTNIRFHCLEPGEIPMCSTLFLEHAPSGHRNPGRSVCSPDYAPYFGRYLPDAISRFGVNLPFRDPSGLARYPVDGSQLPQSRVVVRVYQPADHFTRRLVIPEIRLKDWGPFTALPAPNR